MNATDPIQQQAQDHPDRSALVFGENRVLTFGDLGPLMQRTAQALRQTDLFRPEGELPGGVPRIGLACPDGLSYILLSLGLLRAGACVAPIAPELAPAERDRVVRDLALTGLVVDDRFDWKNPPGDHATRPGPTDDAPPVHVHTNLPTPREDPGFDETQLAALRPAFIRFSSGTTGTSKGVVISHRTLLDRTAAANRALAIGPGDKVIWILPMAHHFAVSMMLYLIHGAATVIVQGHLADDVLTAAGQHKGTVLYGSPYHHALLAADTSGRGWPTLRLAVSTAAALPEATAHAFQTRFGVPLTQALGVIEAGLPAINTQHGHDKPTSIGRPTPEFEIVLRDPETHQPVPDGEVGELHLRGPGLFDAYLKPWRPRAAVLDKDGWFATGDLARRDAEGDLFLVGRTKSVINVAGLKVFPEEVEAVLSEHPQVAAVRVMGRAHPQVGAVPVAQVVATDAGYPPDRVSLGAWCRDKLAAYKRPMVFTFVEALPRTASGKIRRAD